MDRKVGEPRVHFSRPLLDRSGQFAGVIAYAVPPWELNRIHDGIDLGEAALVIAAQNGYQGALMAPTEILAGQRRDGDRHLLDVLLAQAPLPSQLGEDRVQALAEILEHRCLRKSPGQAWPRRTKSAI